MQMLSPLDDIRNYGMTHQLLKKCPFCGAAGSIEDHRLIWCVRCSNDKCECCIIGDRAPEPDGDMPESYWDRFRRTAIDRWNKRA